MINVHNNSRWQHYIIIFLTKQAEVTENTIQQVSLMQNISMLHVILWRYNITSHPTLLISHILLLFPEAFWFAELPPIPQFPIHDSQDCHRLPFDVGHPKLCRQFHIYVNENTSITFAMSFHSKQMRIPLWPHITFKNIEITYHSELS
jgi:hypothetical protein